MAEQNVIQLTRKKRILLIEDDNLVRRGLSLALMSHGFTVHAVATAEEAIKVIQRKLFNGIICDFNLPGMSGLEFFIQAKQRTTRSTNILITAYGFDKIVNKASIAGIDAFYEKPFSIQTLISGLNMAKREAGQEAICSHGGGLS